LGDEVTDLGGGGLISIVKKRDASRPPETVELNHERLYVLLGGDVNESDAQAQHDEQRSEGHDPPVECLHAGRADA
jgi:hypothetical protein